MSRLAGRLRLREEQLAATNQRLKASSEERMRHMLQTTHQLKAPFAAIHAQTQLLLDGYCGPLGADAVAVETWLPGSAGCTQPTRLLTSADWSAEPLAPGASTTLCARVRATGVSRVRIVGAEASVAAVTAR